MSAVWTITPQIVMVRLQLRPKKQTGHILHRSRVHLQQLNNNYIIMNYKNQLTIIMFNVFAIPSVVVWLLDWLDLTSHVLGTRGEGQLVFVLESEMIKWQCIKLCNDNRKLNVSCSTYVKWAQPFLFECATPEFVTW